MFKVLILFSMIIVCGLEAVNSKPVLIDEHSLQTSESVAYQDKLEHIVESPNDSDDYFKSERVAKIRQERARNLRLLRLSEQDKSPGPSTTIKPENVIKIQDTEYKIDDTSSVSSSFVDSLIKYKSIITYVKWFLAMSVFVIGLIVLSRMLHSVSAEDKSDPAGALGGLGALILLGLIIYYCRCCCRGSQQNVVIVNQPAPPPPPYVQFV
ncbi:unnamed protein product [Diamesa serratosioi]